MKRRGWLRLAGSIVLLGVTAALVDVRAIGAALHGLRWPPMLAALALSVPLLALTAWRWSYTAARMGIRLRFGLAWREYYASTLLNQVLPGGVGGDVARVMRMVGAPRGAAARCVVLERASGQLALWLTILGAAAWWGASGGAALALAVIAAVVGLGLLLVLALRWPALASSRIGRGLRQSLTDLRATMLSRGAWAVQLGTSLLTVALLCTMFVLCVAAVGVPVSPVQAVLVAPLVLAASALPFSVGGWGIREAAAAAMFGLLGLSAEQGAAAGAAFGAINLLSSAPGAAVLLAPPPEEPS